MQRVLDQQQSTQFLHRHSQRPGPVRRRTRLRLRERLRPASCCVSQLAVARVCGHPSAWKRASITVSSRTRRCSRTHASPASRPASPRSTVPAAVRQRARAAAGGKTAPAPPDSRCPPAPPAGSASGRQAAPRGRRHRPQPLHGCGDLSCCRLDVRGGGETAETEAQRALGLAHAAAQGPQHVRWLAQRRIARRTGGQPPDPAMRSPDFHRRRHRRRHSGYAAPAVPALPLMVTPPRDSSRDQSRSRHSRDAARPPPCRADPASSQATPKPAIWWVGRFRAAGPTPGRRRTSAASEARLAPARTNSAPMPLGPWILCADSDSRSTGRRARSSGSRPALCAASTWNSHRLRPAHLTDALDVLDDAGFIVDVHQGHQRGVGAQCRGDRLRR